ncbi:MAG: hypothetical protein KAJ57_10330 [Woeseiaceae bacterium]|nr:hypothetical protein [Woeseiaceae bacterium]
MKRILNWLETKFSRHSATIGTDEWHPSVEVRVKRTENAEEENTVEISCGGEYRDRVESHRQVKDVPMPDIYACDDTVAQRQLNILNEPTLDDGESAGFDPYNSGRFDTSKTRKLRSNK